MQQEGQVWENRKSPHPGQRTEAGSHVSGDPSHAPERASLCDSEHPLCLQRPTSEPRCLASPTDYDPSPVTSPLSMTMPPHGSLPGYQTYSHFPGRAIKSEYPDPLHQLPGVHHGLLLRG